jgi:hypothetical protein
MLRVLRLSTFSHSLDLDGAFGAGADDFQAYARARLGTNAFDK